MKLKVLYTTIILLYFCSFSLYAQSVDKEEKKLSRDAEIFFEDGDYAQALILYLDLFAAHPENPIYNFCLGVSYLNLAPNKNINISRERAIPHLEFANKSLDLIDISYYLGKAYHLNYQWDRAIEHYQAYIDSLSIKEAYYLTPLLQKKEEFARIERQIEMCQSGKLLMQDTADIVFENMGRKINSGYPDYAPAISADNEVLIFTSRRPPLYGKGKLAEDYLYYEDIFITYKKDGEWVEAIPISQNINTKKHNASIGLSADAQTLFVYKNGDIYISELVGAEWSKPVKLGKAINTSAWETHITITSAQNTIYFVSDRKGGYGGRDIYRAYLMRDGTWGRVENLGPTINTPDDEDAPFIHPDERHLYFSSNGHNSMGGFDIFYAELKDGKWGKPINMGYPINTPGDDIYFTVSSNGRSGYLSTIRDEGMGEKDIFIANMPDTGDVPLAVIRGLIKGVDNQPLGVDFIVTDRNTKELVGRYRSNSVSGKYLLVFPPGRDYDIVIIADGYVPHSQYVQIPEQNRFYDLFQEIQLTPATRTESDGSDSIIGQQVVVRNAFFDIDSVISVVDKDLTAIEQKELAYSYFLGNLERSSAEERKALSDQVSSIEGVGDLVADYEPSEEVHITELASNENLEMHILGYDTVYTTSSSTSTKADAEALALAGIKLEEVYFASREEVESAEYHPEESFVTKGLKEGIEEVFEEEDTLITASSESVAMRELAAKVAEAVAIQALRTAEANKKQAEEDALAKADSIADAQAAARKRAEEEQEQRVLAEAEAKEQAKADASAEALAKEEEASAAEEAARLEETTAAQALEAEKKKAEEEAQAAKSDSIADVQKAARKQAEEQKDLTEAEAKEQAKADSVSAAEEAARLGETIAAQTLEVEKKQADASAEALAKEEEEARAQADSIADAQEAARKQTEEEQRALAEAEARERAKADSASTAEDAARLAETLAAAQALEAEEAARKQAEEQKDLTEVEAKEQAKADSVSAAEEAARLAETIAAQALESEKEQAEEEARAQADSIADAQEVARQQAEEEQKQRALAETEAKEQARADSVSAAEEAARLAEAMAETKEVELASNDTKTKEVETGTAAENLINEKLVLTKIYFDFNSSVLNTNSRKVVEVVWNMLNTVSNVKMVISGHTDDVGNAAYNQLLSLARANSVVKYLIEKGISGNRLMAEGFGESRPVKPNNFPDGTDNPKGRKGNRRTELRIVDVFETVASQTVSVDMVDNKGGDPSVAVGTVCTGVIDRRPVGAASSFSGTIKKIYYFSNIRAKVGETGSVTHVWYYEGRKMAEVSLEFRGSRWRTYSSKNIMPAWKGKWKVEVVSENGTIINSSEFTVE